MKIQDLTEALSKYLPDADISIVEKAYEYSAKAHQGQSRRSGEAYISPVSYTHLTLPTSDLV